jgi:hypothetical protein
MAMLAEVVELVIGVDTHKDTTPPPSSPPPPEPSSDS